MYLVTGATGNIGSKIAEGLLNQRKQVRLFLRDPAKYQPLATRGDVLLGDFTKPETFKPALEGIKAVFLMNRGPDQKSFAEFVKAARESGVEKIVFLSTLAAANSSLTIGKMHKQQEDTIRASGITLKVLRPGGFMSNTFGWIGSIKAEGRVYNAMGPGRFAPVAPEDIAAVGVRALTEELADEVFNITGEELTTVAEQVGVLSEVISRKLECIDLSEEEAVQVIAKGGLPQFLASAVVESFRDIRQGKTAPTFDTVEKVTGRKPVAFTTWVKQNAFRFA
jgi:uncharacterized protein YbjT (DUF2867 family)